MGFYRRSSKNGHHLQGMMMDPLAVTVAMKMTVDGVVDLVVADMVVEGRLEAEAVEAVVVGIDIRVVVGDGEQMWFCFLLWICIAPAFKLGRARIGTWRFFDL